MKKLISIISAAALVLFLTSTVFAQDSLQIKNQKRFQNKSKANVTNNIQHGRRFVDENGDGYNDNAPDADGDGIPNGLDPDYDGPKLGKGNKGFVDLDGDGINDNAGMNRQNGKGGKGGFGMRGGKGGSGVSPQSGSGMGQGTGTGNCDGTGPKGKRGGRK